MRARRFVALAAGALLFAACSDNGTQPARGAPGLTVKVQGPTADTVMSPSTRMVATVNDSAGRPVSGAAVTFRLVLVTPAERYIVGVSPVTDRVFGMTSLTAATDASGRASADLVHEVTAGTMQLIVEVSTGAGLLADTITAATTPGAPARLLLGPHDTTLYQGGTSVVAASTADRYGNARLEHPTLSAATGAFTISGTTITAMAGPSRQVVHAQYNAIRDSLFVSIVPHGVIAVRGPGTFSFTTMELDGSARAAVVLQNPTPFTVPEQWTEWTADGNGLLYYVDNGGDVMYRTALDGAATRISVTSPMGSDAWPQTSLDGSWIYFSSLGGSDEIYVYRMHADGSAVERLSLAGASGIKDIFPSPSPDNSKVVYATTRGGASLDAPRIEVLDIASGAVTSLGTGNMPRWSPDGQWIVFIRGGGLILAHPDGTGERQLSAPAAGYQGELTWSPDSKWIIAPNIRYVFDLFEVSTGLQLPLQYSGSFQAPDWRPY